MLKSQKRRNISSGSRDVILEHADDKEVEHETQIPYAESHVGSGIESNTDIIEKGQNVVNEKGHSNSVIYVEDERNTLTEFVTIEDTADKNTYQTRIPMVDLQYSSSSKEKGGNVSEDFRGDGDCSYDDVVQTQSSPGSDTCTEMPPPPPREEDYASILTNSNTSNNSSSINSSFIQKFSARVLMKNAAYVKKRQRMKKMSGHHPTGNMSGSGGSSSKTFKLKSCIKKVVKNVSASNTTQCVHERGIESTTNNDFARNETPIVGINNSLNHPKTKNTQEQDFDRRNSSEDCDHLKHSRNSISGNPTAVTFNGMHDDDVDHKNTGPDGSTSSNRIWSRFSKFFSPFSNKRDGGIPQDEYAQQTVEDEEEATFSFYWWEHTKVRKNWKVVLAAFLLTIIGLCLMVVSVVTFSLPTISSILVDMKKDNKPTIHTILDDDNHDINATFVANADSSNNDESLIQEKSPHEATPNVGESGGDLFPGLVFLIAGMICFVPGCYHVVYVYFAVQGRRGFDFNQLPLFNN